MAGPEAFLSRHAAGKIEVRASSPNSRGGTFAELSPGASVYFAFREAHASVALPGSRPFLQAKLCLSSVFPMSSKPKPREAELNFESAMDRLEKIVEQMESGKLPLEEWIVRYEEGMKLVKICQERLANAEQKIEIITRNSAGKAVVQEFEPAQEAGPPAKTAVESESTDDEIKLF